MKAAVLRQIDRLDIFDIEDVDLDGLRRDGVHIRALASGLCHSDYLVGSVLQT